MKSKLAAEFFGTAFLLMMVVGSGIMGENLAQGNGAIALLANSLATGAGLFVLIQCLGPISGAHFNPAVSMTEAMSGRLNFKTALLYSCFQIIGAFLGVILTHAMFGQRVLQLSEKSRTGSHLILSECIATFGLISVIGLARRKRTEWAPVTIADYITSAYWFTSSTSFANPAVTLARSVTNTFCGIRAVDLPGFFIAQIAGALIALAVQRVV